MRNSAFKQFMKDGTEYEIHMCVEPGTKHTSEFLKKHIIQALKKMSTQSLSQRFVSPIRELTEKQLEYLTTLDGKQKVAWCASMQDSEIGLGLSRYILLEEENNVAEFAITIVDEFQGQGIGYELLKKLIESAKENGIETLRGYILHSNKRMISLCRHFHAHLHSDGTTFIVADIPTSLVIADATKH